MTIPYLLLNFQSLAVSPGVFGLLTPILMIYNRPPKRAYSCALITLNAIFHCRNDARRRSSMSKRATLLALTAILILSLAGCGSEPTAQPEKKAAAPAEAPKKEEPPPAVYELTKESLTDHPD